MRSRRQSPILNDVKHGTPSGRSNGRYVMNDGTETVAYRGYILQLNGLRILQLDGRSGIQRRDKN